MAPPPACVKTKVKANGRWRRWRRILRLYRLRLMRLRGEPHQVAGGMAIGVFVGMTPTVPLHTVLAVIAAFIAGKSKLAAALGVWVANPLVLPFIYLLDYQVGRWITGTEPPSFSISHFNISVLMETGWDLSYPLLVGGLVTGALAAVPSYFITKRILLLYREEKRKRAAKIAPPSQTT